MAFGINYILSQLLFVKRVYVCKRLARVRRTINGNRPCPGWVAQLARALSKYTKVVGLIPGKGTYKKQPRNTHLSFSLLLSKIKHFFILTRGHLFHCFSRGSEREREKHQCERNIDQLPPQRVRLDQGKSAT